VFCTDSRASEYLLRGIGVHQRQIVWQQRSDGISRGRQGQTIHALQDAQFTKTRNQISLIFFEASKALTP
jgi:hypothetical protein